MNVRFRGFSLAAAALVLVACNSICGSSESTESVESAGPVVSPSLAEDFVDPSEDLNENEEIEDQRVATEEPPPPPTPTNEGNEDENAEENDEGSEEELAEDEVDEELDEEQAYEEEE